GMRRIGFSLALLAAAFGGCKAEKAAPEVRSTRTVIVEPEHIDADRQAVGEVKPRYESDLSFRVPGKVLVRSVDVGAIVRQGDTLATLDTQDFQNRLRSAEADVASAKAKLNLTHDQLRYTVLKADFDGVITAVNAEPGQNVSAGQLVVRRPRPTDKDAVFN